MCRDGLLPGWFFKTDRHGTPQRVTWIAGIASALLARVFPIRAVADLTNIGTLAAFVVVCLSVIIFRLPFMPVVPAFGMPAWRVPDAAAAPGDVAEVRHLAGGRPGQLAHLGRKHSLMNPDSPRLGERVVLPHGET
ncbi:hypothetical protein GCM10009715_22070 [Paeniglutamicibacter psychrophenolicus]|uniref:Uncharacterized protein n=1 Tax=Paeniglutamicibacter psychrophenolicus TaxID=257454 RepID=A0ABS4WHG7_9MICC|nr:hypothetical protein [Paeniglutamicibacter psychrophenolicus]